MWPPRGATLCRVASATHCFRLPARHTEHVRRVIVFVSAAALVATATSSAARIDPSALALRQGDVPSGFRVDPDDTGVRTNAQEMREFPDARPVITRFGRLTGYQSMYRRGSSRIQARADVFRTVGGARGFLAWIDLEWQKVGIVGERRARAPIGTEGHIFWSPQGQATVLWRHGHVFGGVLAVGVGRDRALALARTQECRIAAALG
jgi:hypothetical protein